MLKGYIKLFVGKFLESFCFSYAFAIVVKGLEKRFLSGLSSNDISNY